MCAHVKLLTDLISTQHRDSLGEWSTSPISPAINKHATNKQTRLSSDEIELNVCRTAAALAPCLHMIIICPFSAYMLIPVRGSSPQGQEAPLRSFPKLFTYCQKYSTNALHIPYLPLLRVPLLSTLRNVLLGHLSSLSPSLPLSLSLSLYLSIYLCPWL